MGAKVTTSVSASSPDTLTAGHLKSWLEHIPDAATIRDITGDLVTYIDASWDEGGVQP